MQQKSSNHWCPLGFFPESCLVIPRAGAQRLVGDVLTEVSCPVVPYKFRKGIFFTCATFPTLEGSPPSGLFLLYMSGAVGPRKCQPGPRPTCTASRARFIAMPGPGCCTSPSPNDGSITFTPTWWARYNIVTIAIIFSPL
jgi:hypothetical protein